MHINVNKSVVFARFKTNKTNITFARWFDVEKTVMFAEFDYY